VLAAVPDDEHAKEQREAAACLRAFDSIASSLEQPKWSEARASGGSVQHDSLKLMNYMRCAVDLRCKDKLHRVLTRSMDALLPPGIASTCLEYLDNARLPSSATLSKSQALLDVVLVLLSRETHPFQDMLCWVWADSSPQASYEVFQSQIQFLPKDLATETFELSCELASLNFSAVSLGFASIGVDACVRFPWDGSFP
jgi:hypothetical protein